jgi:hypothetical protein
MSILRRALFPITAALLGALAVLFVSTASLACEAPEDQGLASMSMNDDGSPCEQKTVKVTCQKACLVFCQSLVTQGGGAAPARDYQSADYPSIDVLHPDFTVEADDPPPRT